MKEHFFDDEIKDYYQNFLILRSKIHRISSFIKYYSRSENPDQMIPKSAFLKNQPQN